MLTKRIYLLRPILALALLFSTQCLATDVKRTATAFFYNIQQDGSWMPIINPTQTKEVETRIENISSSEQIKKYILSFVFLTKPQNFDDLFIIKYLSEGISKEFDDRLYSEALPKNYIDNTNNFLNFTEFMSSGKADKLIIGAKYTQGTLSFKFRLKTPKNTLQYTKKVASQNQNEEQAPMTQPKEPKLVKAPKYFNAKYAGAALIGLVIVSCGLGKVTLSKKAKRQAKKKPYKYTDKSSW